MKIQYQDEYGETLYESNNISVVPRIGETVSIKDEDFRVKNITWFVEQDGVVVTLSQGSTRPAKSTEDGTGGRLEEMNRAILAVNRRQDSSEKKSRMLTEQVTTIRKHINNRIQQEKKHDDTR